MHRRARFILIQTVALWLCLALICQLSSGLTQGETVALRALEHLGKPYVLGEAGPDRFDCSGLVMFCLAPEGFEFPLHSAEMIGTDERYPLITDIGQLLTGDIVCFDTVRDRDPSDHMGFYLGARQFVHASSTGEVKISSLDEEFYRERFTGARRYVQVYTYLPTGKQISKTLDELGVTAWWASLGIAEWWASLGIAEWWASLDIPGKWASLGIGEWWASLGITEWWASLWNRIFPGQ